ncbi:protein of unknown function (plasmid) [Cupriavidus taiwanensis]|nr:protein of unknown function [Cupriavidus taiwanensis]
MKDIAAGVVQTSWKAANEGRRLRAGHAGRRQSFCPA